jgi:DNA polymerase-3 subunit delta
MTAEQIIVSLKKKEYKPIYFLMGEEAYYIDQITDYITENVLSEADKAFNQTILYGKDITMQQVIMAARRYPMMAPYQVVVVKEAQNMKDIDNLEIYLQNPLKSTILVINYRYKTLDKRKKVTKQIDAAGILFDAKKLYDNQMPQWITDYLKQKGKTIDPKANQLLCDNIGNDLLKMAQELDKLIVAVGPEVKQIIPDHVEKNIGISKEFNVFELQNAIFAKNNFKANQIVNAFGKNPKENPFQPLAITLFNGFVKLLRYHYLDDKSPNSAAAAMGVNPFFVQDYIKASKNYNARKVVSAISLIREYDMKSKGFASANTDSEQLMKELIFKIMHL